MAVVINEFEVAVEPPVEAGPEPGAAVEVSPSERPTPEEILLVNRRHRARQARIDAT